jgi:lipoate---protein ligase
MPTEHATWRTYNWQLIRSEPLAPAVQMALDEALLDAVDAGTRPPTLRIWEWASSAIVIGRFQSLRNEVDLVAARQHGMQVVRRISGGGAMFIDPGGAITYSVYAPVTLVAGMSAIESYAFMDQWVLAALQSLGLQAWYQPINDITSTAGKIGGAAQIRRRNSMLHHVTMAYDMDSTKMMEVLRIGREKISDKGIASAAKRVDPLRSQTGMPRGEIINHMVATFRERYGLSDSAISEAEYTAAHRLVEQKFGTETWLTTVP